MRISVLKGTSGIGTFVLRMITQPLIICSRLLPVSIQSAICSQPIRCEILIGGNPDSAVQVLMSNFTDSAVQFLKSEFVVNWFYPDFHVFCLAQFFFYMLNYLAVFVESFLVRVNHI